MTRHQMKVSWHRQCVNDNTNPNGEGAHGPRAGEPASQPAAKPRGQGRPSEPEQEGPRLRVDWSPDGVPESINLTFRE